MPTRLSAIDASFLFLEDSSTPMHAGGVAIFAEPPEGFDHERLVRLIRQRLPFVPRYRQRVREVPFGIARPVWVDDEQFDVTFHVRRSALPKPGTREQLGELVARLMSRPLDRTRPLWEMYLIEGLADGDFAIVSKSHQALVDGLSAVDIAQVMLDDTPDPPADRIDMWAPRAEPRDLDLLSEAMIEAATRPAAAVDAVRGTIDDVSRTAARVGGRIVGLASTALAMARPVQQTPLNVQIGGQRRFAMVDLSLAELKSVRTTLGGTVNDTIVAVITGGLRSWLHARGLPVAQGQSLRAMLPISIAVPAANGEVAGGNRVSASLVDLPIGEPDPAVRLQQISYQLAQLQEAVQFVGADAIVDIVGFGPPTLHALGARASATMSSRLYNLVITNVPGPQRPLYAAGSRMLSVYPVVPLTHNQALSIGLTSYDGGVYLGLYADRDALADVDLLGTCLRESATELLNRAEQSVRTLRVVGGQGAARPRRAAT